MNGYSNATYTALCHHKAPETTREQLTGHYTIQVNGRTLHYTITLKQIINMFTYNIKSLNDEDSKVFINALTLLSILKESIYDLEYTGDFHKKDEDGCQVLLNEVYTQLMKKLYETE